MDNPNFKLVAHSNFQLFNSGSWCLSQTSISSQFSSLC